MESSARLRYFRGSPQKLRLVADLIRGKDVQEAAYLLEGTTKKAAEPIAKLLKSAIANAESRHEALDVDKLFVKEIHVDPGPVLKRIRPAPMGRAFRILKRMSHITIKLETRKSDGSEG